jgi:lysozyme family protein
MENMENNVDFLTAFKRTVGLEGGFVDHPLDRGGPTKYGLSQKANPDLDIPNLTIEEAQKVYYERYWKLLNIDGIESELIKLEIFDTAVNCGVRQAKLILQDALNFLGESLLLDAKIGPQTIRAVHFWIKKDVAALFKALNGFQFMCYAEIVEHDHSQRVFSRGWMQRIQQYRREIKEEAQCH